MTATEPGPASARATPRRTLHRARAALARTGVPVALESGIVALAVWALYFVARPDPLATLGALYDDVIYLSLGKALATGAGYRAIYLVHAPVNAVLPPGLPAVLALLWRVGGDLETTVILALHVSLAVTAVAAGLLWSYSRRAIGNGRLSTLLLVIGPLLLDAVIRRFSGAMAEPWFVLGWAGALLTFEGVRRAKDGPGRLARALALGVVLAATTLMRMQGIVLLAACLVAVLLVRGGWRAAAACTVAAALPLVAWFVWHGQQLARWGGADLPGNSSYLRQMPVRHASQAASYAWAAVRTNAARYPAVAVTTVAGWASPKAAVGVAAAALLALIGAWELRRTQPALLLTVAATVAVVLLWPFDEPRYLMTILPFAGLCAAAGAERLVAGRRRSVRLATAAIAVVAGSYVAAVNWRNHESGKTAEPPPPGTLLRAFADVTAWVKANTSPADRILVDYPAGYYLRTGRTTAMALPEQGMGSPSVFAVPGRYYAQRILVDSISVIIDQWPKRDLGPERPMVGSLEAIRAHCPGVLRQVPPIPTGDDPSPAYYRVTRDSVCLARLAAYAGS